MQDELDFYTRHSAYSDPGEFAHLLEGAPLDWAELAALPPKVILHYFFASTLDSALPEERQEDRRFRSLSKILARMAEIDAGPLDRARPPERRFSGNCRDFSLLTCGLLRQAGVPARLRCGFATYFTPGFYEDHWICEAWDKAEGRWRRIDAQLDQAHLARFEIPFDTLDVPGDAFLSAGEAWPLLRDNPDLGSRFGVSFLGIEGGWFVAGSLLRDLAALNKVELQPWDYWSIATEISDAMAIPKVHEPLLEEIARATIGSALSLDRLRALYARAELKVPQLVVGFPYGPREEYAAL